MPKYTSIPGRISYASSKIKEEMLTVFLLFSLQKQNNFLKIFISLIMKLYLNTWVSSQTGNTGKILY